MTFSTSAGTFDSLTATLPPAGGPAGVAFPHGLFDWTVSGLASGQTITMTMTFPSPIPVGAQYWKVIGGVWTDVTSLLGSDDGDNVLTLTITDGGLGDADGVANGQISDPGGVGNGPPAKTTPTITWANPADIVYGTALTLGVQLNATASVPGTLAYTPLPGTTLHAGAGQMLSVDFTPGDAVHYNTAAAIVSINVTPAPLHVKADDQSRKVGQANPPFTATYTGFVNGDTASALSGTLTFSTPATSSSPAGPYAITPSGLSSSDYTISFVAGTLTVTPDPDGRMYGNGHLDEGRRRHHFVFRVTQQNHHGSGRFEYWVTDPRGCPGSDHDDHDRDRNGNHDRDCGGDHRTPPNRFEATSITQVTFSDDPAFRPGRGSGPQIDSVVFSGAGRWNGTSGYTFEVRATDRGEPGRHRDTFSLVIRNGAGTEVAHISGALDGGNIEATPLSGR